MSSSGDPFGSLAALFTSPTGEEPRRTTDSTPSLAAVTTVLVGNLPVMPGLWLTQLADHIGRAQGATGLLRFDREEVTIELLHADGRQLPPSGPEAVTRWLPRGSSSIRRWLLCAGHDVAATDILAAGNPLLLITGSDEAAITSSYLRLKHLADEAIQSGVAIDRIGLVIVGTNDAQAKQACARLADAARSFLGMEVELHLTLPKVERVESSARASYSLDECPELTDFARQLQAAKESGSLRFDTHTTSAVAPVMPPSLAIEAAVEPKEIAAAIRAPLHPGHSTHDAPAPHLTNGFGHTPGVPQMNATEISPSRPARPVTRPAPTFAAIPVAQLPQKLVPLLPGLRPLGISCPVAHEVELALDDSKRMHVIGRSDQLARVRIARTWAIAHQELLGLAFAELKDGFEVVERILLADAREAIPLHGTGVLLDVLVIAETPAGVVQIVVSLNDSTSSG